VRTDRSTLTQFLIEERRRDPDTSGELDALILDVALACKAIADRVAQGALGDVLGDSALRKAQGETQKKLDLVANEIFLRSCEWGGHVAGMVSEELEGPYAIPETCPRGEHLLVFDPLDGSSNIDVNVSVGSIFSILRGPRGPVDAESPDFLQPGARQLCAGYAIYGPSTMLVLTIGTGVHGFTLDPRLGEFILTHPSIRIPETSSEFAINASRSRFWEPAIKRYVDECLAGGSGPRNKDFNMRWVASLVAELHRILMRGGIFLYPQDRKDPQSPGRLRLLYECNPVALLVEQAGGLASTGHARVLDVLPTSLHQRIGFVFGSREEVERVGLYHREHNEGEYDAPLFGSRGLFRNSA